MTLMIARTSPSARGDGWIIQAGNAEDISIHAPPRGATDEYEPGNKDEEISIHAPPRGATLICTM